LEKKILNQNTVSETQKMLFQKTNIKNHLSEAQVESLLNDLK